MARYLKEKLAILKEFEITLTSEEEDRLRGLATEISIDHFMRAIYNKYL